MMGGSTASASILASLLRAGEDPCPVLLLGAGASFRSGVPTASEAVKHIARLVYSERELHGTRPPERVKPTEWEPWLQGFPWFIQGADRLAENFPLAVKHLLMPAEFRKRVLLDLMQPRNGLSSGYRILADFVNRGLVRTILTTNFDPCLTDALKERQPHIRQIHEVHRGPGDYAEFDVFAKAQVVWLHGRAEQYSDQNAAGETDALDADLVSLIRPLRSSPVVVIGYRGSEHSVMDGVFGQDKQGRLDFPNGVYWCIRHGETPHPYVEALQRRLGSNFRLLQIDGFDELFDSLDRELTDVSRYATTATSTGMRPHAFDERIVESATIVDLDLDLALSVMRDYCVKLRRSPVTSETLPALLQEQGLIDMAGGSIQVSAGALLLFGKSPQAWFPHAVIAVTEAGKKKEIYDGNLITQHRRLLEKLDSAGVNPILRIKRRRQHDERPAYPARALVELLVNMLVHRDYEAAEPATIDIRPGMEIVLSNPGGLTKRVAHAVSIEQDGRFTLSEGVTDQRNPALCDVFFGISAMERAGTGLLDVARMMLEHGGGSAFYSHPQPEQRFEVRITQPRASAGSAAVARSGAPTGMYVLNALPFSVVPERLSIVELKMPWQERPRTMDFAECGTFVPLGSSIWSFAPLPVLTSLLAPIADIEASVSVSREEVEASDDSRRILSWLLRKHWERYLRGFVRDGLRMEDGRKYRAYFEANDGESRTVIWNSPQRRGNRREVVKKRRDGARGWFENEGFGYEIVEMGGLWCVRIKPFYMFTGRDGRTPLPSFSRTAKATSRMKYDRNKNVEADLVFWSSFLGRTVETINLGDRHVGDLILDASFLTVEIPEIGLESDESGNQDRMSA